MQVKEFSNLLSDSSKVIVSYNGFGKLKFFSEVGVVTTMLKVSFELGDIPWTGEANKEILQEIDKTLAQGYDLKFDPTSKLIIGCDHELFYSSDEYEIPTFNVGDPIARIELSTSSWKAMNKFGKVSHNKLHVQVTGNVLSLSVVTPDGVVGMHTLILEQPLPDGQSITFTIPAAALFEAESACIEIGSEKILIQSADRASMWTIDRNESEFFPGLIPEGAIEIGINKKDLTPLLDKGGRIKINVSKKNGVQLKSTNGKSLTIKIEIDIDVPPRTSFQIAVETVESAIKLIGTAKLMTLLLPVGMQYVAVSAAAIRCLLPTIIDATARVLTAQELVSPDPIVLESQTTTVEVEGKDVTMTVDSVEKLDIPASEEPTSRKEAIEQLESATESIKETLSSIPVGSELEVVAKQTIKEALVDQAQTMLDAEKKGCPFSKEDIKKITNAIVRTIARIEAIRFNLLTGELHVTFRS